MSTDYRQIFTDRVNLIKHNFANAIDGNPNFTDGHNCFEVLRGVNFVAAHGDRVRNHRDKLSPNVIDNVDRGLKYNLADVAEAHLQQSKIAREWFELFNEFDIIICPATSTTPFLHADWTVNEINGERMETYMRWLAITYLPTMALACGAVIPCGIDHENMPFGIQILSAQGNDRLVAEVAKALEESF